MNNTILIQPMTRKDITQVCFVWKHAGIVIADYTREKHELKMLLDANSETCLVAKNGQQLVGTILGASNGRRVWIYHLAVLPEWQAKGIGSKLLTCVEAKMTASGATKLLLGVGWENLKVIPFYEKQGFTPMMDMIIFQKNLYMKGGEHV